MPLSRGDLSLRVVAQSSLVNAHFLPAALGVPRRKSDHFAIGRPRGKLGRPSQEDALFHAIGIGDDDLAFAFPVAARESKATAAGREHYVVHDNVVSQFFRRTAKHRDSIKRSQRTGVFNPDEVKPAAVRSEQEIPVREFLRWDQSLLGGCRELVNPNATAPKLIIYVSHVPSIAGNGRAD